jgi:ATP-dependent Clp protease protease subunit
MPIGVPRIIYCWGEELPAQWTDIYNFIFRRRMVFLMQYLDDELCNQICGLLINIHMEDRSKELEKKEIEKSGVFKSGQKTENKKTSSNFTSLSAKSVEDLLTSEDDLAIDQNNMLEQYTLQKITMEWLNWNAQFFDYNDEPYLYYLADILSKDFSKDTGNLMYNSKNLYSKKFFKLLKNITNSNTNNSGSWGSQGQRAYPESNGLDVYSPFRLLANFAAQNYSYDYNKINPLRMANKKGYNSATLLKQMSGNNTNSSAGRGTAITKLLNELAQQKITNQVLDVNTSKNASQDPSGAWQSVLSEKALSQRNLKREYLQDRVLQTKNQNLSNKLNYLDTNAYNAQSYEDYRQFYRKQTERTIQEEESKKVFVIINSFGGSVGNGITVHDALQFIKAGSLTLGLGVAASAASLVLAGGTIGERYVTEGCHVMIHQPEGGLNGQASDIWIDANEIMKIRLDVAEIYSLSTYRPRHKILRDLDRDFYLTATETIQYGLADEIATNDVMHSIVEMTSKVWDFHDSQQQRLLESRESASAGLDTQTQT